MYSPKKTPNNSVTQILNALIHKSFLTEAQIFSKAFNYHGKASFQPNKKYADMLRRALRKGYINRVNNNKLDVENRLDIGKARYVYYLRVEGAAFLQKKGCLND